MSDEVRRCARCREAAVVKVSEVRFPETGESQREYCCQSCGRRFTVPPKSTSISLILIGGCMFVAVLPLAAVVWGVRQLRWERRYPLVPGAPLPLKRFDDGPPVRRCAGCGSTCGASASVGNARGLPTGTRYDYACGGCGRTFVVESAGGHAWSFLWAVIFALATGAYADEGARAPWKYGVAAVAALLSLSCLSRIVGRLVNRARYRVITPSGTTPST